MGRKEGNRIDSRTIPAFVVLALVGIFSTMCPEAFPFFSSSTWGMLGFSAILWASVIQVYWAIELFEHLVGAPWGITREYHPISEAPRSRDTMYYGDAPRKVRGFKRNPSDSSFRCCRGNYRNTGSHGYSSYDRFGDYGIPLLAMAPSR